MIKSKLKAIVFSNKALKTLFWVVINHIALIRNSLNLFASTSGSTHQERDLDSSVKYIQRVFNEYKQYGAFDKFHGNVLELGPGDNAGVALLLRADGANQVDLVDRFYSARDAEQQQLIYNALSKEQNLEEYKTATDWDEQKLNGVSWYTDDSAEAYLGKAIEENKKYDYIISRAVLEHVIDPLQIIERGIQCLPSGGKMVHIVDFHDHAYYSKEFDDLTFLSISSMIYPLMVKHCGGPNRILIHEYRSLLTNINKEIPIEFEFYITKLFGSEDFKQYEKYESLDPTVVENALKKVNQQRDSFAKKFKPVDSKDLTVSGICLVVTKK